MIWEKKKLDKKSKKKISIKRMRVKIKRKNKLKGNNEFSFWDLNWKGIKTLTKKKIKRTRTKKNNTQLTWIEGWNQKQWNFYKRVKEKIDN
jgi:hypothetical protein